MKKITIYLILMLLSVGMMAQWQPVPIAGSNAEITSMFNYGDDLMVGTMGDGIFKSVDNGGSWTDISGDIGNSFVNDIRGGGAPTVIWAATQDGAYYTVDHTNYQACTNPPLSNNDINYFWFGDSNSSFAEWAIGTNGGGVFVSSELSGPWTASNNGLAGDALKINDISGYTDDEVNVAVVATEAGIFVSTDTLVTWTAKNNGLSGAALQVNRVGVLGSLILALTDNGFYYSIDLGETWLVVIPDEKFNSMLVQPTSTGIAIFLVGENVYYTYDLQNFYQINLVGLQGEVTCVAQNSTHVFLGTAISGKGTDMSGGLFRKPIEQLITGVPAYSAKIQNGAVEQNIPNPCSNQTAIAYSIKQEGRVMMNVFDVTGKLVKKSEIGYQVAGTHRTELSVSDLDPGIYFYSLELNGNLVQTRKMIIR